MNCFLELLDLTSPNPAMPLHISLCKTSPIPHLASLHDLMYTSAVHAGQRAIPAKDNTALIVMPEQADYYFVHTTADGHGSWSRVNRDIPIPWRGDISE